MKRTIISLFLLCGALRSQNQHYGGVFPTIDHSGRLTNKLTYGLYYFMATPLVNVKDPEISRDATILLFYSEQSLSYAANKRVSFTGSYVYQRANVLEPYYVNENRLYIQTKYTHTLSKFNFAHRLRFDARFIQGPPTQDLLFNHRARYLFAMDVPLTEKNNLYFTMYEELFFNTKKSVDPIYEENWAYAALGIKLNDRNRLEPGILYISWSIGKPYWFNQYYFQLTWISHLDFTKNKEKI